MNEIQNLLNKLADKQYTDSSTLAANNKFKMVTTIATVVNNYYQEDLLYFVHCVEKATGKQIKAQVGGAAAQKIFLLPENGSNVVLLQINPILWTIIFAENIEQIQLDCINNLTLNVNSGQPTEYSVKLTPLFDAINRLETNFNSHVHTGVTPHTSLMSGPTTSIITPTVKDDLKIQNLTQ